MPLSAIAESFSEQVESTTEYPYFVTPSVASAQAFLTQVYVNLFNRAPDGPGLAYWTNELTSGNTPVGEIILNIISGATDSAAGNDMTTVLNKIEVGCDWAVDAANAGINANPFTDDPEAVAGAKAALDGVDDTAASVTAALAETDAFIAGYGNDDPITTPATAAADEDVVLNSFVEATDPDGDTLTYSVAPSGTTSNGTLVMNADGSYVYTPNADFVGSDSFTYQVTDGNGGSATGTVAITVSNTNDAPIASNVIATTAEDNAVTVTPVSSDIDLGDTATYSVGSNPSNGSVVVNANGTFTYTPNADFFGTDAFDYIVTDAAGATSTATATVTVTAVDDAPVAQDASSNATEGGAVVSGAVVATDVDSASITYALTGAAPAGLTFNADGSYSFDPTVAAYDALDTGETATISVTYTATASGASSNAATLEIVVTGTNDAPVAAAVQGNATEDGPAVTLDLAAATSDVDGETLTYSLVTGAAGLSVNATTGLVTLDPSDAAYQSLAQGETLNVGAVYAVTDGTVTVQNTISFTVTGTNDVPTASDLTVGGVENTVVIGAVAADDVDGDVLTYTATDAQNGDVSMDAATGQFEFTPTANFSGTASFKFTVTDSTGAVSAEQTVTLNILDVVNVLTPGIDVINLTGAGAEVVQGNQDTFNSGDEVTGGAEDTLHVSISGDNGGPLTFSGIEVNLGELVVTNDDAGQNPARFDMSGSQVDTVATENSTNSIFFSSVAMNADSDADGHDEINFELRNLTNGMDAFLDIENAAAAGLDEVNLLVVDSDDDAQDASTIGLVAAPTTTAANLGDDSVDAGIDRVNLSTMGSTGEVLIEDLNTQGTEQLFIQTDVDLIIGDTNNNSDTIENAQSSSIVEVDATANGLSTGGIALSIASSDGGSFAEHDGVAGNETKATLGSGDDTLISSDTDDLIDAGEGDNLIEAGNGINDVTAGDGNNDITTGTGRDEVTVGDGNNDIDVGDGSNTVTAGDGNNDITGGDNDDTVTVGNGDNDIATGAGEDLINAGDGANTIDAGDDDDVVNAGNGGNTIDLGAGDDEATTGDGADEVTLGMGDDTVSTGAGDDVIIGGADFDASWTGNDTPASNPLDPKNDVIDGGDGRDELRADAGSVDENFDQVDSVEIFTQTSAGTTVLSGDNNAPGTSHAEDAGIDTINTDFGYTGDDVIDASTFAGDLTVNFGGGDDDITTGSGNDTFNSEATVTDADMLDGGVGNDTLNLDSDTTLTGANGITGFETWNLDTADNGSNNDFFGNQYNITLSNGNTPDTNGFPLSPATLTIDGSSLSADVDGIGPDQAETLMLDGSAVTTFQLDVTSGAANDTITLGNLNDNVVSGAGNDDIDLLAGNNTFDAGTGNDDVTLGTGNDSGTLGEGNDDLFVTTATLNQFDGPISGGDGFDYVRSNSGLTDVDFTGLTEFEALVVSDSVSETQMGAEAVESGINTVYLTNGNDDLNAAAFDANISVFGYNGNDEIDTGAGDDYVLSGSGDSTINTRGGDDRVVMGSGDDTVDLGAGGDTLQVHDGELTTADVVEGGADVDTIQLMNGPYESPNANAGVDAAFSLSNVTNVERLSFADATGPGDEEINALLDVDTVNEDVAQTHNISISGAQTDVDTVTDFEIDADNLSDGLDTVNINLLNTIDQDYRFNILGGLASTNIVKEEGGANFNITAVLGAGSDSLSIAGNELGGNVPSIDFGAGVDSLILLGGSQNQDDDYEGVVTGTLERLTSDGNVLMATLGSEAARAGLNEIDTTPGGSDIELDVTFVNDVSFTLGANDDVIDASAAAGAMTFNVVEGNTDASDDISGGSSANDRFLITSSGAAGDDFSNVDGVENFEVIGSPSNDVGMIFSNGSFGDVASNRINVDATILDDGNANTLTEGGLILDASGVNNGGAFDIDAGNGSDNIQTGNGSDVINLGLGDDTVDSGAGNDQVTGSDGNKDVTTGAGEDTITLGDGNNTVDSGDDDDMVTVGDGNNTITTGGGEDTVVAGEGNNTITTGSGDDSVTTGNGDNVVDLGAGTDVAVTGSGDDLITGGGQADMLTGGTGADDFRYVSVSDSRGLVRDTITDFDTAQDDEILIETQVIVEALEARFGVGNVPAGYLLGSPLPLGTARMNNAGNDNGGPGFAVDGLDAQGAISQNANDFVFDYILEVNTAQNYVKLWVDVNDDGVLNGQDLQIFLPSVAALMDEDHIRLIDTVAPVVPDEFLTVQEVRHDDVDEAANGVDEVRGDFDAADADGAAPDDVATYAGDTTLEGQMDGTDSGGGPVTYTASVVVGTYGTFTLLADGSYTYETGATAGQQAAIEALDDFDVETDTLTVTAFDGYGNSSTATVTVTVEGADDDPTFTTVPAAPVVFEDEVNGATANLSGTFVAADVDAGDVVSFGLNGGTENLGSLAITVGGVVVAPGSVAFEGVYGTMVIDQSGGYTYTPGATAAQATNIQQLSDGQVESDPFTVELFDGDDAVVPQAFNVTVTGENDQPSITITTPVSADAALTEGDPYTATFQANILDIDVDDTVDVTVGAPALTNGGASTGDAVAAAGAVSFDGTGLLTPGAVNLLADPTAGSDQTFTFSAAAGTFDFLAEGEVLEIAYTLTATDDSGVAVDDTDSTIVTVVVTGTNDAPTISVVPANGDSNSDVETETDIALLDMTGSLTALDLDLNDTVAITTALSSATLTEGGAPDVVSAPLQADIDLSSFTVLPAAANADAPAGDSIAWTFSSNTAEFDALQQGDILTLEYVVTVTDSQGATGNETVSLVIIGTNDEPVINSIDNTLTVYTEAASQTDVVENISVSGVVNFTDLDVTDEVDFAATGAGTFTYNTVTYATAAAAVAAIDTAVGTPAANVDSITQSFNALTASTTIQVITNEVSTGVAQDVTMDYIANNVDLDWLREGDTLEIEFQIQATDEFGAVSNTMPYTVTITGTNDVPVITAGDNVTTAGETADDSVDTAFAVTGVTGTLTVSDGDVGDTLSQVGPQGDAVVTYNAGAVPTDTAGAPTAQNTDSVSASITALQAGANLVITPGTSNGESLDLNWAYNAAATDLDWLREGDNLTLTYTVTVNDGTDDSTNPTTQTIVINVTGENDGPVISAAADPADITEVAGDSSAQVIAPVSGSFDVTDQDLGDTLSYAATGSATISWNGGSSTDITTLTAPQQADIATLAATARLDFSTAPTTTTGEIQTVNYTYSSAAVDLDWLDSGESLTLTYTVAVDDNAGTGTSTDTTTVTITILGTDDDPIAVADTNTTDQDTILNVAATGVLSNDVAVDANDTITVTMFDGLAVPPGPGGASAAIGDGGILTMYADGSYDFDPNGQYAFLDDGENLTETVTYTITTDDGETATATLSITVTGVNDAPVAVDDTEPTAFAEDTVTPQAGTINLLANDSDPDVEDIFLSTPGGTATATLTVTSTAGASVALTDDGAGNLTYTYDLNATDVAGAGLFESLAVGETATDTFTYRITDNDATDTATVTVTINGANDAPVAVADTGATDEDTVLNVGPLVGIVSNDTDVDASDTLTVGLVDGGLANVGVATAGDTGGLFTINVDGSYSFDPNGDYDDLGFGETRDSVISYQVTDGNGGVSTSTVTVTVSGVNDAPVIGTIAATATGFDISVTDDDATDVLSFVAGDQAGNPLGDGTTFNYTAVVGAATLNQIEVVDDSGQANDTDSDDAAAETWGLFQGTAGADSAAAPTFDNNIAFLFGGDDDIVFDADWNLADGGADIDEVDASGETTAVTLDLGTDTTYVNFESATGGSAADTLTASNTSGGTLNGGLGSDTLNGGTGDDTINGQSDADSIEGNAGNDSLTGDFGADTINGGAGNDTIEGGSQDDVIDGGADNDSIDGGAQDDNITAGTGADTVITGAGADTVDLGADADADVVAYTVSGATQTVDDAPAYGADVGYDEISNFVVANDTIDFSGLLLAGGRSIATDQVQSLTDNAAVAAGTGILVVDDASVSAVGDITTAISTALDSAYDLSTAGLDGEQLVFVVQSTVAGEYWVGLYDQISNDDAAGDLDIQIVGLVDSDALMGGGDFTI
ncbi:Ig-like domain-containing protein [Sulfitobacter mediterraneus]|nr:Ig-like domain-containing protein [Sulfitobacter mediterraneus]MCD2366902.1 Ig-like domain-containing protein [Sulfitobacter mediterraneus]